MRLRSVSVLLATLLFVAACHKSPPAQVELNAAFRTLPLPPNATALVQEGGPDAMQILFISPAVPDSIVAYYQKVLTADPFHLVNERRVGKSTSLYAEQDGGPPIWVTINPNGSEGSQVILAGAKDANRVDSLTGRLRTADSGGSTPLPVRKP